MMKCLLTIAFLFLLNSFLFAQTAVEQTVAGKTLVKGVTVELKDGKYNPLPEVSIRAYREGPIGKPTLSDKNGVFTLEDVNVGDPFKVLFYATVDRVPELQQLAGVNTQDFVVIALLTVDQEKTLARSHVVPEPSEKLRCILRQLPEG